MITGLESDVPYLDRSKSKDVEWDSTTSNLSRIIPPSKDRLGQSKTRRFVMRSLNEGRFDVM